MRTNRNTDISLLNSNISKFDEQIGALEKFDDIVESMKIEMNKYDTEKKEESDEKERKEKEKRKNDKAWDLLKILIGAAVGGLITFFVTHKNTPPRNSTSQPQIEQQKKDSIPR